MADKLADLSPEEKEKRIAEMKAKMQAAAAKNKAAGTEGEKGKPTADETAKQAPKPPVSTGEAARVAAAATAKEARAVPAEASPAVIEASTHNAGSPHPAPVVPEAVEAKAIEEAIQQADHSAAAKPASTVKSNGGTANGGTAVAAGPLLVAAPPVFVEETAEQKARKAMNRREFLTYAWGAALGLLVLEVGAGMFGFMYPRFKAGEFGGKFFLGPVSSLPPTDAPPQPDTAGKFWLVNTTDEGPKALYMVCTHLGCLYKWAQSNNRFECPCHGSKFSREGFYIEGPAPRSLDTFLVAEENGVVTVDTGKKTLGQPSAESPARAVPA
ncbi:MAG: Rieske 2Fe-2S domain-containing protein [Caldilineaceae bacterium]